MMWLLKRSNFDIWFGLLVSVNGAMYEAQLSTKAPDGTRYHRSKTENITNPRLSIFLNNTHDKDREVQ